MGMQSRRRQFIGRHADPAGASMLEIGAMDSPTFPELDCCYLDWFSREELQAAIVGNPNRIPDRVVEADYVVKDKSFAVEVSDRFDLLIANHVIEHVADPIHWLAQLDAIATPGASLFLAVPDRRFTFDYLRPVSTAADLLRANAEDLDKPSRWQMLEAIFYYRPIRAREVWAGDHLAKLSQRRHSLSEAMAISAKADREYVDTHCHVFSFDSFPTLIEDLLTGGYSSWSIAAAEDVRRDGNEFLVQLVAS